ncbi:hypothetical protein BST63_27395 [Bradyrhizobium canariense]|uniref:Uncharacterized protein n=1 Tax=Bradyrhizobium canariense TaxID=255045 RepID=A0ABX3WYZ1_9BRAD|nr:hypothetical protein [Bradyrhizobium canariense]OSJ08873.1 hypothetical protein BSR47_35765 [Bradyrhizobium canariense]OSJ24266.1 hypothetical protein BST63_27395 [Bradyrhizobium canariense]
MRLTSFRSRSSATARLVTSAKCETAIAARDVLLRDAIIQATLDPAVQTIEFGPLEVPDPTFALGAIVVERDAQRLVLDHRACERTPPRTVDEEGGLLVVLEELGMRLAPLDSREIRKEPRFTNCREVWRYCDHDVPLRDRLQIMQALAEEGPQSIMELANRVSPTVDIVPSVCALACSNILELELAEKPLGPRTIVRERR